MPKLRSLPPLVRAVDTRSVRLPPKVMDPIYNTHDYQRWRAAVVARAQGRCEAVDHGMRCTKAMPEHRVYADHIVELRDGGSLLDLNNGRCLCQAHHVSKTNAARGKRYQSSGG